MKKIYILITYLLISIFLCFPMKVVASMPQQTIAPQTIKEEDDDLEKAKEIPYLEFDNYINNKKITTVYMDSTDSDYIYFKLKNPSEKDEILYKTQNPQYETFKKELLEKGVKIEKTTKLTHADEKLKKTSSFFTTILILLTIGIILFTVYYQNRKKKEAIIHGNQTKADIEKTKKTQKTFNDIAGLNEVKKDMICLVDFIKNSDKYKKMGAELPKGVILYGPPGTGKTLLAKAVAGEADVPFFYMSGSDFIEKYVGVGAQRVRELFKKAKKSAPCIIFIDEIDAIGGKRGQDSNDSSSEDRKTINALLTEMDGFESKKEVLVIGATNRIEDLDPALLRPGRFTEKYCVPLPYSSSERLEIINIYKKNKKFDKEVNFQQLAKDTIGNSPAQIEALLNEAAIIAVQDSKKRIDNESIEKAITKQVLNGHIKETKEKQDEDLKLVAWHEAGHALVGKILGLDVTKVTIQSTTTGAGGVTFTMPKKMGLESITDLEIQVKQLYAGRCAEYLLYNDWNKITTGASNDIEKATQILYNLIAVYGMTNTYDMLNLNILRISNEKILEECQKIAAKLKNETIELLTKNRMILEEIVEELLDKETIYGIQLDKIINKHLNPK